MSAAESPPGPGEGLAGPEHGRAPAASPEDAMSRFAGYVVNRLFSVGLNLESARSIIGKGPAGDRVAAATAEVDRMIGDIRTRLFDLAADRGNHAPDRWPLPPGGPIARTGELLDQVLTSISGASALLHSSASLPRDNAERRITEARRSLDEVARKVRDHVLAEPALRSWPGPPSRSPPGGQERSAPTADRAAVLQERMAHTARALQTAAADYAALLEQRADLTRRPGRMDYPAEIQRWQAFADQAEQMARHWEQPPHPEATPDTGQDRT